MGMTKNGLDDFVLHAEAVQVRREAPAKSMPAMPLNSSGFQYWTNDIACELIKAKRIPTGICAVCTFCHRARS